ncbi:MAG: hypothetical protein K6G69_03585 [Lachnospiraceae bacterium]|nr:hypothetical protein [Lachnospiraceae bacterium]
MKDYNIIDEELFDKVEVDESDNRDKDEIRKEKTRKKVLKAIKIALYALLGAGMARLAYKTSDAKDRNTDYINRF